MLGAVLEHFYPGYNLLTYALVLVGVTSVITSVQRLAFASKELKDRQ